jgi:transposase-like protein
MAGKALEPFYPVIFFDALRVNIRDEEHISKKAVYLALAVRLDGQKEVLGLCIEKNEGAPDFSPRSGWGSLPNLKTAE